MSTSVRAQKEFNVWCFGQVITFPGYTGTNNLSTKLSFADNGPVSPSDTCIVGASIGRTGILLPTKGSICDAAGNLLLYSDGIHLYDRRQRLVPGGYRLNDAVPLAQFLQIWLSGRSYQGFSFAPGPGGYYYAFYWDRASENGSVAFRPWYAVVDMRRNGGYGAVVRKQPLLDTYSARMTVVRHANNRDFWLLTRDLDTRGFRAYLLNKQGLNPVPVVSLAGVALYPNADDLKAAPNGRRLVGGAYARSAAGPQSCRCVYDFDNATGVVSNELVVQRVLIAPYQDDGLGRPLTFPTVTSASFSPDSRLLYSTEDYLVPNPAASRRHSDLWQYDLTRSTPAAIAASRFWVSNVPTPPARSNFDYFDCFGLQLAPDATLWATTCRGTTIMNPATQYWFEQSSAIVRRPNVAGPGCGFELNGYTYPVGHLPQLTFPNIITNMLYAPPTLNHEMGCADDSVQFWASSAGLPAGLRWDFGEPASGPANAATGSQVAHRYARSGSYAVRLLLADGRVLTQAVTVAAQAVDFTGANIFTPNADGLNEAFVPVRGQLPGGRLRLFSRWGVLVFGTDNAEALRWDGAGAAAGEYFYQLDYPDCQGRPRQRRGLVTLVR